MMHCIAFVPFRHLLLGAAAAMALDAAWPASGARAQGAPAQSAQPLAFNIPAQSLPRALAAFSRATGVRVLYAEEQPLSVSSQAVSGTLTAEQALARMLAGTGFTYRFANPETVTLVQAPTEGAIMLPPVEVTAAPAPSRDSFTPPREASALRGIALVIDTPRSLQVVPQAVIEGQAARDINRILENVSGVTPRNYITTLGEFGRPIIRGYVASDILRDGVRIGSVGLINPDAVESVEVLKGPAGLLYGSIAPGGIVNYNMRLARRGTFGEVSGQVGSYGLHGGLFDVNWTNEDETASLRLVTSASRARTFMDFVRDDRDLILPSITLRPTPDTEITGSFEYSQQRTNVATGVTSLRGEIDRVASRSLYLGEPGDFRDLTDLTASLRVRHRFSDALRAEAYFLWHRYELETLYHFPNFTGTAINTADNTISRFGQDYHGFYYRTLTGGARVIHEAPLFGLRHTLTAGVDWYEIRNYGQFRFAGAGLTPRINRTFPAYGNAVNLANVVPTFRDQETEILGVFVQSDLWVTDYLKVTAGLRFEAVSDRNHVARTDRSDRVAAPSFGALLRLDRLFGWPDETAIFANYSESYMQAFSQRLGGGFLEPTRGRQHEVGVRWLPLDGRLNLSATVFRIDQTDIVEPDPRVPGFSISGGDVRSQGIEFDVAGRLSDRWQIIANYTYFTERALRTTRVGNIALESFDANPARHRGSLWSTYQVWRNDDAAVTLGLGVVGQTRRTQPGFGADDVAVQLPGWVRADALVQADFRVHGTPLTAQLNVTNLFDKEYFVASAGTARILYGEPRTVVARLTARF
ncbi:TonB-dependent siderophore receptor [Plastoroseomonas hellenica]|uniref:TonB-dependent siderophore receptor n=1 Tax=Plastoroseomonas hellenica TaxID=2687306 RepID=UPI001BADC70F|nr:TonB-dependent receptor [Plastoroseomonas hellenica]MBR0644851.1 TonB-dependent receptor [Plastoroseomonas hellenica]